MNVAANIGHNNPPETPYERTKQRIEDLYEEAKNWLDGEEIASQEQADELQKLMRMIQEAEKEADEARKAEAKPHDDAKAEIQSRYNELIGKTKTVTGLTVRAIEACKKALAPWLQKLDDENRAKAEAARKEAEEKQRIAMEAMQARDGTNLEENERAEALVKEAKQAESEARKVANAKASAKGEGRAVTLRSYYTAEVTDYTLFARHAWTAHRAEMTAFLDQLAKQIVDAGVHNGTPGVTVHHERRPV